MEEGAMQTNGILFELDGTLWFKRGFGKPERDRTPATATVQLRHVGAEENENQIRPVPYGTLRVPAVRP